MKTFNATRPRLYLLLTGVLLVAGCGGGSEPEQAAEQTGQDSVGQARPVSVRVTAVEPRTLQSWVYSQGTARSRQREFLTFTQQGTVSYVKVRNSRCLDRAVP